MDFVNVELPRGLRLDGSWRRDAVLRPVAGRDEAFLMQQGRALSPASRTTALLARCLCRLGSVSRVTADVVRSLSVGDREALVLHLRCITLGDTMSCVLTCPACAEKLDLDLHLAELLLPPYPHASDLHEVSVGAADASCRARLRVPNGADQEQAAAMAADAPDAAADFVLRRCVQEIVDERTGAPLPDIPAWAAPALVGKMAELDPQAEILLDLVCPACSETFRTPFDIADYFHRELCGRERDLYCDIHHLASRYHWSENEILRLSRRKRMLYLDLLSGAGQEGIQ
jgi:hypothetical protein